MAVGAQSESLPDTCYLTTIYPIGPVQENELVQSQNAPPQHYIYDYAGISTSVSFGEFNQGGDVFAEIVLNLMDSSTGITLESDSLVDLTTLGKGQVLGQLTTSRF